MADLVVDFVARGDCPDRWLMVLVEEGPWGEPIDDELRRLQGRLYACIDAAVGGQLAEKFPETKGKNIRVRVDGYNLPTEPVREFFERFSKGALQATDYAEALARREYVASIDFELNLESIN